MRKIIPIILTLIFPFIADSQNKMSKKEIFQYWIQTENNQIEGINYKSQFDSLVVKFIDNLKSSHIDTIGAYAEDYVGSSTWDSCECGLTPWIAFVQWIQHGKTYQQKITKCCTYQSIFLNNSDLINYYISNKNRIDKERIMPVITGTSRDEKGQILFEMSMVDHTTHYTIFCNLSENSKLLTFTQYDLENEDNIFYTDNINSSIYSWRKIIENQIYNVRN